MSRYNDCLNELLKVAGEKGYLTFDDIMDATESYDLSLSEVDKVNEAIQIRGVIVYEEAPQNIDNEELDDYSRVNYEEIFKEIIEKSIDLKYLVDKIREMPTPQYSEISILTMQNYNGNSYARERLILLHLRVVLKVALAKSKQYDLDINDAVSSGIIGLITAVDKYDPNGFSAFQSYASLCITRSIQRECNPLWVEHYFPAHYKEKMIIILSIIEDKYSRFDYIIHKNELNDFLYDNISDLNMTNDEVLKCLNYLWMERNEHYFLDDAYYSDDEKDENYFYKLEKYFKEEVLDCKIENEVMCEFLKYDIQKLLETLPDKSKKVLLLRYGLFDGIYYTLEQIGKEFNVTRERIRQIEAKAIQRLKVIVDKKYSEFIDYLSLFN